MAATAGYNGQLKIGANTVAQVSEVSFDLENNMEDVSVMGDRASDFLPTLYKGSLKAKVFYDLTDTTGQLAIQNAFFGATTLTMTFSPAGGATNTTYSVTCYVAKLGIADSVGKVVEQDIELQPTGAITAA